MRVALVCLCLVGLVGCDGDPPDGSDGGGDRDGGVNRSDGAVAPSDECGPVRLTNYETAAQGGWCEFPLDLPMLPAFVRDRTMTAAIAEPYNGSSYGGMPGEACGECWEVGSATATEIVMITDLCPDTGDNPCDGSFFHLDLSRQASDVLNAGFFDQGVARRVPCPVEGNIHVLVNDENFSYLRLAFVNHRVPIRSGSVQAVDGAGAPIGAPVALSRSGAWQAISDEPLDRGGAGVVFTLTSATGQTVESTVVVPTHPARGSTFDLGVQLDGEATGGMCSFRPTGDVYIDGWGGIDRVRWSINPWGEAENGTHGEVTDGCYMNSASCYRFETFGQYSGCHVTYPMRFATDTYTRLTMQLSASAPGMLSVAPSMDGERCQETDVAVGVGFTEVSIDIAAVCGGFAELNGFTLDNPGNLIALTLDEVRFVP